MRPRVFQDRVTRQWTCIHAAAKGPFSTWAEAYAAAEDWAACRRRTRAAANDELVRAMAKAIAAHLSVQPRRAGGRRQ